MGNNSDFLDPLLSPTFQDDGTDKTRRANINLVGFTVTDDPTNDATVVTATGGGGGGGSIAFSDLAEMRAASHTDDEVATVASPAGLWVYDADTGAGLADDGATIVRPTDISLGANGRWYNVNSSPVLPTIAALRLAVSGLQPSTIVVCYSLVADGGGGVFVWNATNNNSTRPDNGGTIIVPTALIGGTGCWERQSVRVADIRYFGAKRDDATKDTVNDAAIAAAIAYLIANKGGTLYVPAGTWYISAPVTLSNTDSISIEGEHSRYGDASTTGIQTGSWLRCSSRFPVAGTILRMLQLRNCEVTYLGVDGLGEDSKYYAGRGVSVEGAAGLGAFVVHVDRVNCLRICNMSKLRGFHRLSNLRVDMLAIPVLTVDAASTAVLKPSLGSEMYPFIDLTDVSGGTARGQAKFKASVDNGNMWLHSDNSKVVTFTAGTPGLCNYTSHPYVAGDLISFNVSGGALPNTNSGALAVATAYQVINPTANNFQLAPKGQGSVAFTLTDAGSGTMWIARTSRADTVTAITTAATVVLPNTAPGPACTIDFPAGTYATSYFWEGEGHATYVGNTGDYQIDNVTLSHISVNQCATLGMVDASQSINIVYRECDSSAEKYNIIVNVGGATIHCCQLNGGSRGKAVIEIRRGALEVKIADVYTEIFGGAGIVWPSNSRGFATRLDNVVLKMSQGPYPIWKMIDAQQGGRITAHACSWWANDVALDAGVVYWGAGAVKEDATYIGAGITRSVGSSCSYKGSTNKIGGAFGDASDQFVNSFAQFDPMTNSDDPGLAAHLPACGIFQGYTNRRLNFTDKNKIVRASVDFSVLAGETAQLVSSSASLAADGSVTSVLSKLVKGPIGALGKAPLLAGDWDINQYATPFIWLDACKGVRLSTTMRMTGTSPALTLSGSAAALLAAYGQPKAYWVKITTGATLASGNMRFQWSDDGGTTVIESGVVGAATYLMPRTGVTLNFAAGTYVANDIYEATVDYWFDQETYFGSRDVTCSVAASRPIYVWNAQNSLPGLKWDTGNQYLQGAFSQNAALPVTYFIVAVCSNQAAARVLFDNVAGANPNRQSVFIGAASVFDIYFGTNDATLAFDGTSVFIMEVQVTSAGNATLIKNRVTTVGTVAVGTNSQSGITLGLDGNTGVNPWRGNIYEVIGILGIPDGYTRRAVNTYLKAKWATP